MPQLDLRRPVRPVAAALALIAGAVFAACSSADTAPTPPTYITTLAAANERPIAGTSAATGTATIVKTGSTYAYTITYAGLSSAPAAAHIHGPGGTNSVVGVLVGFSTAGATATNGTLSGTFTATDIAAARGVSGDSLDVLLRTGNIYANVHTTLNPGGEIRGQLALR